MVGFNTSIMVAMGWSVVTSVLHGLVEIHHLLLYIFIILTLVGPFQSFGLANVLIPDGNHWLLRFRSGLAVSGLLFAFALSVAISSSNNDVDVVFWSGVVTFVLSTSVVLIGSRFMSSEFSGFALGLLPLPVLVAFRAFVIPLPEHMIWVYSISTGAVVATLIVLFLAGLRQHWTLAGESLCAFLSFCLLAINFLEFWSVPLVAVVLITILVATLVRTLGDPYKLNIPITSDAHPELSHATDPTYITTHIPLNASGHTFNSPGKKPLVIVCTSGGGIRSAIWTIRVLVELEKPCGPLFKPHIFFGSSGGMLGVTRYLCPSPETRISDVEKDGLRALVQRLFTRDILNTLIPCRYVTTHRGEILEQTWRKNFGLGDGDVTFKDLHSSHLVYSPMLIEDGRRLIISNLELGPLTYTKGPELDHSSTPQPEHFSTSALEFRTLFGEAAIQDLSLFTATRLSATFPYVMPISSLPTNPRRRAVDAGYYDNYGVSLATSWLEWTLDDPERRAWLESSVSRVLVIQIRDHRPSATRPVSPTQGPTGGTLGRIALAFESLTGPVQALLQSRASQIFHNDDRLADILRDFNRIESLPLASTVTFELQSRASLSWALSQAEKAEIASYTQRQDFQDQVASVKAFLGQ